MLSRIVILLSFVLSFSLSSIGHAETNYFSQFIGKYKVTSYSGKHNDGSDALCVEADTIEISNFGSGKSSETLGARLSSSNHGYSTFPFDVIVVHGRANDPDPDYMYSMTILGGENTATWNYTIEGFYPRHYENIETISMLKQIDGYVFSRKMSQDNGIDPPSSLTCNYLLTRLS